jgi:hypothetical protein
LHDLQLGAFLGQLRPHQLNECKGRVVEESAILTVDNTPSLTVSGLNQSGGWINPSGSVDFKDNPAGADVQGQAVFSLPNADYKIRADYLSGRYWSEVFNATDATVDINHGMAAVHVFEAGLDLFDVPVYLFNEDGRYLGQKERSDSSLPMSRPQSSWMSGC